MANNERHETVVCVLGPPRVTVNGVAHPLRGLAGRLLCHLAISHGRSVGVETLIDRLWNDPPPTARSALQVAVHKLRSTLEPNRVSRRGSSVLQHTQDGYTLATDGCAVDMNLFESSLASAHKMVSARAWNNALECINASLGLWDRPFGPFGEEPAFAAETRRLDEIQLSAEETLSEIRLQLGESSIDRLQMLALREPLREKRWEHLMIAQFKSGRQSDALRAFKEAQSSLESLGLSPGAGLRDVEERILLDDPTLLTGATPQKSAPFGRHVELEKLGSLSSPGSCVSIVGSPGIGKTRLAEAHAAAVAAAGAKVSLIRADADSIDPWVVVSNTMVSDPTDLPKPELLALIGQTVGVGDVVIIDGIPAGHSGWKELVAQLRLEMRQASLIVTSRQPLDIEGEEQLRLGTLATPPMQSSDESVWTYPAVQLLTDRIRSYRLDRKRDANVIGEIVRAVNGHPLAIELAASRCDVLGLPDVLDELTAGNLGRSSPMGLQQAILAVVSTQDQETIGTLDIVGRFIGKWTTDDAVRVGASCGLELKTIKDSVSRLATSSLVEHLGEGRYMTLACVREAVGEDQGILNSAFDLALSDLAVELDLQLRTNLLQPALDRFDDLAPDFEGAMARAVEFGDMSTAWRIFGSMGGYWWTVQARAKSRYWEARVMAADIPDGLKPITAIRALNTAGMSGFSFLRFAENRKYLEDAVAIATVQGESVEGALAHANLALATSVGGLGDPQAVALATTAVNWATASEDPYALGFAYFSLAGGYASHLNFDEAARVMNRSVGTAEEAGILSLQAFSLLMLGHLHQYRMDFEGALKAYAESAEICSQFKHSKGLRISGVYGSAEAVQLVGDVDRAMPAYQEAFETMKGTGDARGAIFAAIRMARIEADQGEVERAERLLGFATAHLRFHNEDSVRACVLIAQARLDLASGSEHAARQSLASARAHLEGGGIPLGPIDIGLLQDVELALAGA